MLATLPLEKMNMLDKISTMEVLWEDICRNSKEYKSPAWHGDILKKIEFISMQSFTVSESHNG